MDLLSWPRLHLPPRLRVEHRSPSKRYDTLVLWRPLGAGRLGADVRVQLEPCLVGHSILWRTVPATQAGQRRTADLVVTQDEETEAGMRSGKHNRGNNDFEDLTKFSLGFRGLY